MSNATHHSGQPSTHLAGARWLLGGLLAAALAAGAPQTLAKKGFGDDSIEGTWGFSALGTLVPPAVPAQTPAAAVGLMVFDGEGGCIIDDTINIGGASFSRVSSSCVYAVDANGTGAIEATFPGDPGPTPLSFVVVSDATEIRFIRTDLGVASGVARLQDD